MPDPDQDPDLDLDLDLDPPPVHVAAEDPAVLDLLAAALRSGSAVVLPTDTLYGVATLPAFQDRLAGLKGRPRAMPIAVLVADLDQAVAAAGRPLPASARRLAAAFWPGPLTIVVAADDGTTVGIRCPDHALVQALAAVVGPIATTSANRHGEATPPTARAAALALVGPVAVVVDGGRLGGEASSVVDLTGPEPSILREGRIGSAAIRAAVG